MMLMLLSRARLLAGLAQTWRGGAVVVMSKGIGRTPKIRFLGAKGMSCA